VDIALVRELVDLRTRPGQPGGSLTVDRAPAMQMLTHSRPVSGNRFDWTTMTEFPAALYRRGSYGTSRYLSVP